MELFRYPVELLWLTAGFAGLLFFYFKARASSERAALEFMDPAQLARLSGANAMARKKTRDRFYLAALAFLVAAAAGPQWGVEMAPVTDLGGSLVVAMDTSASMGARDLKPSRMENAKLLLAALADKFQDYRVGIIAFSGDAYVQCPLTTDSDAIKYFLSYLAPGMLPAPGTDIAAAITETERVLGKYSGEKVLVLITDGEDLAGKVDDALASAAAGNLKIFTVGIGRSEGEVIPVADQSGNLVEYKKDPSGKTVVSRLNETTLVKIAQKTGAEYIRYGGDPDAAADQIRATVARITLSRTKGFGKASYRNRYRVPLLIAFLLFLIELMFMEKGFAAPPFLTRLFARLRGTPAAPLLLAALALATPGGARAASPESLARKGNSAYGREDFPKAYEYYSKALEKDPRDPRFLFNRGAAYYRMEDYEKAAGEFETAAKNPKVLGAGAYNAGNAFFKLSDLPKAIKKYREAILADPRDEDAKYNLQKALEEQKKKQNKCENPDQKKQDQDKQKKEDKPDKKEGDKDQKKKEQEERKKKEEQKKKETARQQADKLLELMKEKEKSAGNREMMNARFDNKQKKDNNSGKDW